MENRMASAAHLRAGALGITILVLTLLPPSLTRAASTDALLISSIATGGSSASDEYVVIEAVGEPRPSDETVARWPALQDAQVMPYFLHLRVRKPR